MQIKTIIIILLLLLAGSISSCKSTDAPGTNNPQSVKEAEEQLAKQKKEQAKINAKAKKAAYDRYWSMQTKEAKNRIKRNNKRLKKEARKR
jgi:ABC-type uncharacterized transport system YnjBCD substrate-binding protein